MNQQGPTMPRGETAIRVVFALVVTTILVAIVFKIATKIGEESSAEASAAASASVDPIPPRRPAPRPKPPRSAPAVFPSHCTIRLGSASNWVAKVHRTEAGWGPAPGEDRLDKLDLPALARLCPDEVEIELDPDADRAEGERIASWLRSQGSKMGRIVATPPDPPPAPEPVQESRTSSATPTPAPAPTSCQLLLNGEGLHLDGRQVLDGEGADIDPDDPLTVQDLRDACGRRAVLTVTGEASFGEHERVRRLLDAEGFEVLVREPRPIQEPPPSRPPTDRWADCEIALAHLGKCADKLEEFGVTASNIGEVVSFFVKEKDDPHLTELGDAVAQGAKVGKALSTLLGPLFKRYYENSASPAERASFHRQCVAFEASYAKDGCWALATLFD